MVSPRYAGTAVPSSDSAPGQVAPVESGAQGVHDPRKWNQFWNAFHPWSKRKDRDPDREAAD